MICLFTSVIACDTATKFVSSLISVLMIQCCGYRTYNISVEAIASVAVTLHAVIVLIFIGEVIILIGNKYRDDFYKIIGAS